MFVVVVVVVVVVGVCCLFLLLLLLNPPLSTFKAKNPPHTQFTGGADQSRAAHRGHQQAHGRPPARLHTRTRRARRRRVQAAGDAG